MSEKPTTLLGHRSRLKQKFLDAGIGGFLDYEVIELLLTLGTPRRDCKQQAKQALKKFKTLSAVLEASQEDLLEVKGIGPANIFGIRLIQEVSRRFLKERMLSLPVCHSSQEVFDFLFHSLRDAKTEKFKVLFLDAKNQVIEEKTLSEGTVDSSAVYPREIIKAALRHHASSLIFAHNHPSGDPAPSSCDREITKELVFAFQTVQICVLDHIIIGHNRYFSFADQGLISEYAQDFLSLKKRL